MGLVPPVESIRISDHSMPVAICTEATWGIAMLSSLLPKSRDLTRLTRCAVTTMRVGNMRLPFVQRLAVKVSAEGLAPVGSGVKLIPIPLFAVPAQIRNTTFRSRVHSTKAYGFVEFAINDTIAQTRGHQALLRLFIIGPSIFHSE